MKISNDTNLDLKKLVASRLLLNANSGGGKSWAIRRLLEQTHGQIQHIVIDLEGEFTTLREKYDYLLVGQGGDVPVSIRTAELLARRLLELNVSTIIDLSELKHPERITFVKRFLDSLMNAPKPRSTASSITGWNSNAPKERPKIPRSSQALTSRCSQTCAPH